MPNYCPSNISFFLLNTKGFKATLKKGLFDYGLINTKAIKKKCDFLFDSLITLIGFHCFSNLAVLTHLKMEKKMYKESLLILFHSRYKFQQSFFSL